jgi:hypothetical protein
MWKINVEKEKITCDGKIFTFVRSEEHTEEASGAEVSVGFQLYRGLQLV